MLTGKCKEDFELSYSTQNPFNNAPSLDVFYSLPFSMQYGVYVDFFDSVNILMDIICIADGYECSIWKREANGDVGSIESKSFDSKTLNGARKKAIEKANEIYNNQ